MSGRAHYLWIPLWTLEVIRLELPASAQAGVRNAVLALAEADSLEKNGWDRGPHTLGALGGRDGLSGRSERRLRDRLHEAADVGLVAVDERCDPRGRRLATLYSLLPGPDESSGRPDDSAPNRRQNVTPYARAPEGEKKKKEEPPGPQRGQATSSSRSRNGRSRGDDPDDAELPLAPSGKRSRDLERDKRELRRHVAVLFPGASPEVGLQVVRGARAAGACLHSEVLAYAGIWAPQLLGEATGE